jgi:NADH-quinone oxidoreductase subunit M
MNETTWQQWAITITTFLPIAGAIVVMLVPSSKDKMIRGLGVVTTALAFLCSIAIAIGFDYDRSAELQFVKNVDWIPVIGARYHVGIDGISMPSVRADLPARACCARSTRRGTCHSRAGRRRSSRSPCC